MHAVERTFGRERGFTLIEVVVALVVVSLGMLAVIQAVGQTASNSGYLREKTIAHWVAMNRLTEVRLQKTAPDVDKSSDEVEMADQRWKWTMNVTQTPVETIRRIEISVRPAQADEGSSLASVTGFYGTAVAPPGTVAIAWQGVADGDPQQPGEEDEQDEGGGHRPDPPEPEELPPLTDDQEMPDPEPSFGPDPSDPTNPD